VPDAIRSSCPFSPGPLPLELGTGQRVLVHLVRAVGEPQGADRGERGGEREVPGQPARAVHLDRLVQDPLHGERGGRTARSR